MRSGRRPVICILAFVVLLLAPPSVLTRPGSSGAAPYEPPVTNAIVVIDGSPITPATYRHWMVVAVDGNTTRRVRRVIPLAPPQFASCIAQVRAKVPSLARTPDARIRSDCRELFTALNQTVLDFLIKGAWCQLEARRLHIRVTSGEVQRAFEHAKHQQFPTARAFKRFLRSTGQTVADVRYRARVNLIFQRLEARHMVPVTAARIARYYHAHMSKFSSADGSRQSLAQATPLIKVLLTSQEQMHAQAAVDRIAAQHWQAATRCQPLYAIADCAGTTAGAAAR